MIAVPAMSPVPVVPGIHVAPGVRVMAVVAPAALVLVRAPIAALAAESDVGTLPSVPLVMRAHTETIYP